MVTLASLSDLIAYLAEILSIVVIKIIHHVLMLSCCSHGVILLLVLLLNKFLIGGLKWTDPAYSRSWSLMLACSFLSLLVDLRVFAYVIIFVWSRWLLKSSAIAIPFLIINNWRLWTDKGARVWISGHFSWRVMLLWDVDLRVTIALGNQMRRLRVYKCETVWVTISCRFWRQFGHLEITIHIWLLKLAFYF